MTRAEGNAEVRQMNTEMQQIANVKKKTENSNAGEKTNVATGKQEESVVKSEYSNIINQPLICISY